MIADEKTLRPMEEYSIAGSSRATSEYVALTVGGLITAAICAALLTAYTGQSDTIVLWFCVSGCAALFISVWRPSSFFMFAVSAFLFVGFIAKAVASFVFSVHLIEPIGTFTNEWDQALTFAASGLSGVCTAGLVAALYPSFQQTSKATGSARLARLVTLSLVLLITVAVAIYWANYKFHILRIGFPVGIDLDPRLYAPASFIIPWGALLGGLTLVMWMVELRRWSYSILIYVAASLGLFASLSMGSRIQLLLYVLAAIVVVVWRWRDDFKLTAQEKQPSLNPPAAPAATSLLDKVAAVTHRRSAIDGLFNELGNLAVMRWVGLEGAMTAANEDRLGAGLFRQVLSENPAAGSQAIYQKLSGDRYGKIDYYTFLTLPGPVGVASLSGSLVVAFAFMFLLIIVGHSIEWAAARVTQNIATTSVTGVSLAYLVVQMGFPWTLLIYAIELILSVLFLGAVWWAGRRLTTRST